MIFLEKQLLYIVVLSILRRPKQPCLFFSEFDVPFQFGIWSILVARVHEKVLMMTLDERDLCFHCLVFVSKDSWSFVRCYHKMAFICIHSIVRVSIFLGAVVGFSDFHIFVVFVISTSFYNVRLEAIPNLILQVLTLRFKNEEIIDSLTTQCLGDAESGQFEGFFVAT